MMTTFGAKVTLDREGAIRELLGAYVKAAGNRRRTAELLGLKERNLYRWIERLDLWDQLDKVAKDSELEIWPGAPRTSERIIDAFLASKGSLPAAARKLGRTPESLSERITKLDMWTDINRKLRGAGLRAVDVPS